MQTPSFLSNSRSALAIVATHIAMHLNPRSGIGSNGRRRPELLEDGNCCIGDAQKPIAFDRNTHKQKSRFLAAHFPSSSEARPVAPCNL